MVPTTRGACCVIRVRTRARSWCCRSGALRKILYMRGEGGGGGAGTGEERETEGGGGADDERIDQCQDGREEERGQGRGRGRGRAPGRGRDGEGVGTRACVQDVTSPDVVFIIADVVADALADTVPMHSRYTSRTLPIHFRYTFDILRRESFNDSFSLQLNLLPSSLEVQFSKEVYTSSETKGFIDLIGLSNLDPINYKFNLETLYGSTLESFAFELKQRNTLFSTIILQSPPNSSQDISLNPKLDWESSFNVDNYRVQISTDLNFSNILLDQIINDSEVLINDLSDATLYFWRIQQINNCGISDFSEVYSFKTSSIYCTNLYATDLPKNLLDATQNGEGSTLSSINVNFDSQILDVNVLVDLTHTWLEDLSLYLETPAGNQFLLSSAFGGEEDNYTQTIFDQEASENIKDGTAPFTGRFVPVQDINPIYGTSSQGIWKLIVLDKYIEDTGRLLEFELIFCLEGMPEINSDNDSFQSSNQVNETKNTEINQVVNEPSGIDSDIDDDPPF